MRWPIERLPFFCLIRRSPRVDLLAATKDRELSGLLRRYARRNYVETLDNHIAQLYTTLPLALEGGLIDSRLTGIWMYPDSGEGD